MVENGRELEIAWEIKHRNSEPYPLIVNNKRYTKGGYYYADAPKSCKNIIAVIKKE